MPRYSEGTITVSGTTVTGTGTQFVTAGVVADDKLTALLATGETGVPPVATVDSETQITLQFPYQGAAITGESYYLTQENAPERLQGIVTKYTDLATKYEGSGFINEAGGVGSVSLDTLVSINNAAPNANRAEGAADAAAVSAFYLDRTERDTGFAGLSVGAVYEIASDSDNGGSRARLRKDGASAETLLATLPSTNDVAAVDAKVEALPSGTQSNATLDQLSSKSPGTSIFVAETGNQYDEVDPTTADPDISTTGGLKANVKPIGDHAVYLSAFLPPSGDATNAFKQAVIAANRHANGTARQDGQLKIILPAGTIQVSDGALSDIATAGRFGITFEGAGRDSTFLELIDDGLSQAWFYDNGATSVSDRNTFRDICFRGQSQDRSNGFKITDNSGKEKRFQFQGCVFDKINVSQMTEGTTNADEFTYIGCEWRLTNTLLSLNNAQSMLHHFIGCRGEFYSDIVVVNAGGGGEFLWSGGSIIQLPGTSDAYWLKGIGDPATGSQTGQFIFSNMRAELRGATSKIVDWQVASSVASTRNIRITFDNVNLATAAQGAAALRSDAVIIGGGKFVHFKGCMLPVSRSGDVDNYEFKVVHDDSLGSASNPGIILFENCTAHDGLVDDCNVQNYYGRIVARNCVPDATELPADANRAALDFDLGWAAAPGSPLSVQVKVVSLLRRFWPLGDGSLEVTIDLPTGATLRRVTIYKPAQGSSVTLAQWRIGSDDKSTVYAETTEARVDAEHFVDQALTIAPFAAATKVRLWATSGSLSQQGGYALLEYL